MLWLMHLLFYKCADSTWTDVEDSTGLLTSWHNKPLVYTCNILYTICLWQICSLCSLHINGQKLWTHSHCLYMCVCFMVQINTLLIWNWCTQFWITWQNGVQNSVNAYSAFSNLCWYFIFLTPFSSLLCNQNYGYAR